MPSQYHDDKRAWRRSTFDWSGTTLEFRTGKGVCDLAETRRRAFKAWGISHGQPTTLQSFFTLLHLVTHGWNISYHSPRLSATV